VDGNDYSFGELFSKFLIHIPNEFPAIIPSGLLDLFAISICVITVGCYGETDICSFYKSLTFSFQ